MEETENDEALRPGTNENGESIYRSSANASVSLVIGVGRDVIVDVLFLLRLCLMLVNLKLTLTSVDIGRVVVLAGSVHHGVKSILVGAVAHYPNPATWFLHAVLTGDAASCGNERSRMNGNQETDSPTSNET